MKTGFDPLFHPYPSGRYCVTARRGMVCTGNALASSAGLEVLRRGGNAVDAAIATAACLTVTEPCSNGIGSDAFAIVWMNGKLHGLNSSGCSPASISVEAVRPLSEDGKMPRFGWTPVTVPGAPGAWAALNARFGALPLAEDLAPAIRYAREGYPLSPVLAASFTSAAKRYRELFGDRREFREWFRVFTNGGEPYRFGDVVTLPDHARSLSLIAETNAEAFYRGEIAQAIARQSARDGGFITEKDLAAFEPLWVDPMGVDYRGTTVWELPPNGQGITALMALNILKNFSVGAKEDEETYHLQFEAIKLAFADSRHYVTDPRFMTADPALLISPEYGAARAREIGPEASVPRYGDPSGSGTVYLCAADGDGNMVSYIQSNYMGFGSGIVAEGYGVSLQNRGADFSLEDGACNRLEPSKRTYHTIIPGFMTRGGQAVGPFGVMGGYMQPQGHLQVAMNFIDHRLDPQACLDAPRWQWTGGKIFLVEPGFSAAVAGQLARRGHDVRFSRDIGSFGRGQMIVRLDNGTLVGGCDPRTDSNIACM